MAGCPDFTQTFSNCIDRSTVGSILFRITAACSFEHTVGTDMNQPGMNSIRSAAQPVGQKTVHMISADPVTFGKLIEDPECIDNAVRGDHFDQFLYAGDIVGIYIQPAKITLIPGCMEDMMCALAAKIRRQHMTRHTVSAEDKQLHCRNPPRTRMLLISS
ncbi:hypothetical protein D3C81_1709570 [compost metagenome]